MDRSSKRANRTELLFDIPSYTQLIDKLRNDTTLSNEYRAFFALALVTGARVSELLRVRMRDIVFYTWDMKEIPLSEMRKSMELLHLKADGLYGIHRIEVRLKNLKNKSKPFKVVPVVYNQLFAYLFLSIAKRLLELEKPDDLICRKSRVWMWEQTKKHFGNDAFPHIFRHWATSNDVKAGVNPLVVKEKYGWKDLKMYNTYSHLNTKDIIQELTKAYGSDLTVLSNVRAMPEPALANATSEDAAEKPARSLPAFKTLTNAYIAAKQVSEKPVEVIVDREGMSGSYEQTIVTPQGTEMTMRLDRKDRYMKDKFRHICNNNRRVEKGLLSREIAQKAQNEVLFV